MQFNPFFPPEADLNELNLEIQAFEGNFLSNEEIEILNGNYLDCNGYLIAFDKKGFITLENTPENVKKLLKFRFSASNLAAKVDLQKLYYIINKAHYLEQVLNLINEIPDIKHQLNRCNLDQDSLNEIINNLLFYSDFPKIIDLFEFANKNQELGNLFEFIFLLREAFSQKWKTFASNVFSKGAGALKDNGMHLLQQEIIDFALNFQEPKQEVLKTSKEIKSRIKDSIEPKKSAKPRVQKSEDNFFSGKEPDEYEYLGGTIFKNWGNEILISEISIPLGSTFRSLDFEIEDTDLRTETTFYVEKPFSELSVPFGAKLNEYQTSESGIIYSFSMFEFSSLIEYEKRILAKLQESRMSNEELDFVSNLLPEDLPNELSNLPGKDINLVISQIIEFLGQCTYNNSKLVELNKNPNSIFEFVLRNKLGNCLAYSQLIAAILNTNGFETYLSVTNNAYDSKKGFSSVGHAVLLIVNPADNRIIEFDPTSYLRRRTAVRSERYNRTIETREDLYKFQDRSLENQDFFDQWLDSKGEPVDYLDFGTLESDMKLSIESNSFSLRNYLNSVVRNMNNYRFLISDANFDIFKSFLDEEVELDISYIQNEELQYKLKLLGIDSKITIFDLFEFYFALSDESDRNQILNSQLIKACFTLIYHSIDNFLEVSESLELDSGNFRSPDFDSLLDDDLRSLISQVIKERFSQELIDKFRELKKEKETLKLIPNLNSPTDLSRLNNRFQKDPKFNLAFEDNIFLSVFAGISRELRKQKSRASDSPEWDSVREYQIGDDVRMINQKVTARRPKTHVNVYKNTKVKTPDRSVLIVPFCTEPESSVDNLSMLNQLVDLAIKEKVAIKVYNPVDQCIHTFTPQSLALDDYGVERNDLKNALDLLNPDGQVPLIPNVDCMETIYLNAQPGSMYKEAFRKVQGFHSKQGMKCRVIDAKLQ
ncbi:DUF58 domain-containing protein [bacterium]|jgi:hypothetical protein|nr:DUF58 domain-containing protein [bacterium]MBT6293993.1 DUF58 domain-containing protein [bacterium]